VIETVAALPVPTPFVGVTVYVVAVSSRVGVPEIWQFVVLKVSPVFVVRFGLIVQEVIAPYPAFVGENAVIALPFVKV
jgi:hypothetical protein